MTEVTQLLHALDRGDPQAAALLLPLVYDELRGLAAARLAAEPSGNTLQPSDLVHEAYLRLVGTPGGDQWDHRGHFFAAAAEAMRRILVDAARRKRREKHGGDWTRIPLEAAQPAAPDPREDLVALDTALTRLWPWTRRRRNWSSSATSPACPSPRRRKPLAYRCVRRIGCGPSPAPGCTAS